MVSLEIEIPKNVQKILTYLEANGFEAFVVGGCVRDSICRKKPKDWDVCTSANPREIKRVFEGVMPTIPTGEKHGTITVVSGKEAVEVTTYRRDGGYTDGRRPDSVCFVPDIKEDLSRRDFTINAMAYNPRVGILDLFGGASDIEKGLLRCVGVPEKRFEEDALRIMRALRFSAEGGFEIEKETSDAIHRCRSLLEKISAERIYAELKAILLSAEPSKILISYRDVFEVIIKAAFSQENFSYTRCIAADAMQKDLPMRLAVVLGSQGAEVTRELLRVLKTEKQVRRKSCMLCENDGITPPCDRKECLYMLKRYGDSDARDIIKYNSVLYQKTKMGKAYADALAMLDDIIEKDECYSLKQLKISGNDLIVLGISQGVDIGGKMEELLCAVIDKRVKNERSALLKFLADKYF